MTIRIEAKEIVGYAIHPNIGDVEMSEIIAGMVERSRVAFVDLAPTHSIMRLFAILTNQGHWVGRFYDHHLESLSQEEQSHKTTLSAIMGQGLKIVNRSSAPASTDLVSKGQWLEENIEVVFFHADADGFLAYLKGCGSFYSGMESDAEILDGAGKGRKLSIKGKILADAHQLLVPDFSYDPGAHHREKQRVFQIVADMISGESDRDYASFLAELQIADEAAVSLAKKLAWQETELIGGSLHPRVNKPNIAFCDFLPYLREGRKIAIPLWKQLVLERYGPVLLCTVGLGHMGEQVFIELPNAWKRQIDLRDFLPAGVKGRVPGRIQVPRDRWGEFLESWYSD